MITRCPVCGRRAEMVARIASAVEPHGESHVDEYAECSKCHARIDWDEISDILAAEEFVIPTEGGIQ